MILDSTKYVLSERGKPEIQIFAKQGKIQERINEVLNDLHIHRSSIESSKYEYVYDKKKGRLIKCVVTLKKPTIGMLLGNPQTSNM